MNEYERGFAARCMESGLTERQAGSLYKLGASIPSLPLKMPRTDAESIATGAVIGGLAGLAREAVSDKERKDYLRALILSSIIGGSAGLATSYAKENRLFDKMAPRVNDFVKRIKGGINGARAGFNRPGRFR